MFLLENLTPADAIIFETILKKVIDYFTPKQVFFNDLMDRLQKHHEIIDSDIVLHPLCLHMATFITDTNKNTTCCHEFNEPKEFLVNHVRPKILKSLLKLQTFGELLNRIRDLQSVPLIQSAPEQVELTKPQWSEDIDFLKKIQIQELKEIDKIFSAVDTKKLVHCLTWIVEPKPNDEEYIIPPFATTIPKDDFHVMYYTIYKSTAKRILKVVVGNYLIEIPFEIQVPEKMDSMCVIVVAIPSFKKTETDCTILGVTVIMFNDISYDLPYYRLRLSNDTSTVDFQPTQTTSRFLASNTTSSSSSDQ